MAIVAEIAGVVGLVLDMARTTPSLRRLAELVTVNALGELGWRADSALIALRVQAPRAVGAVVDAELQGARSEAQLITTMLPTLGNS